jgi:hypothetical protein
VQRRDVVARAGDDEGQHRHRSGRDRGEREDGWQRDTGVLERPGPERGDAVAELVRGDDQSCGGTMPCTSPAA